MQLSCELFMPVAESLKKGIGENQQKKLKNVSKELVKKLKFNQCKNTNSVIDQFTSIQNKEDYAFIHLDKKYFYPSITENISITSIYFGKHHVDIPKESIQIIKHCRISLLFHAKESWKKKDTTGQNYCQILTKWMYVHIEKMEL